MKSEVLDVRGKTCPIPLLLTKRKLEAMHEGEVLEVLSDFPQTVGNIRDLVERTRNETLLVTEDEGIFRILIRKNLVREKQKTKEIDLSCESSEK